MRILSTVLFLLLLYLAKAVTGFGGQILVKQLEDRKYKINYLFSLHQSDSSFTTDSFITHLVCESSSNKVTLNPSDIKITRVYEDKLECHEIEQSLNYSLETTVDLNDKKFNEINNCCDLRIEAILGTRDIKIKSLRNSATSLYLYTSFNSCLADPNTSPTSTSDSRNIFVCKNQPYFFNMGMMDITDFDSLSFELAESLTAFNTPVSYLSPYNATYPISSDTIGLFAFYLDSSTGDLLITSIIDSFSGPIAIEISEWRKNQKDVYEKISTIHTEILIQTRRCHENNPPEIKGPFSYEVCEAEELCFNISTDDQQFIPPPPQKPLPPDTVSISWDRAIPGATFTIVDPEARLQTGRFCWKPEVGTSNDLPYSFLVKAKDDRCMVNSVTTRSFRIRVKPKARFTQLIHRNPNGSYLISGKPASDFKGKLSVQRYLLDMNHNIVFTDSIARFKSNESFSSYLLTDTIEIFSSGTYVIQSSINNLPINCPNLYFDTLHLFTANLEKPKNVYLMIYPNPAKNFLIFSQELFSIQVFDLLGNLVLESPRANEIRTESLVAGSYILKARLKNTYVTRKFIIL